ncbi:hypothetical protein ACWBD6_004479, partial [Escherichia coli]
VFAGKKSAQIREILISESAWEEMTCLFAPSLAIPSLKYRNSVTGDDFFQLLIHLFSKQYLLLDIR